MPASLNDEGVVIKSIKLGETDRIATVLTRNSGKISTVVKGARKTKSRLGAPLQIFNRSLLKFTPGRNLDIINEAELIHASSDKIAANYEAFLAASQMCNLADKIISVPHEPAASQYLLLVRALKMLSEKLPAGISPNTVSLSYLLRALALAGFEIDPEEPQRSGLALPKSIPAELFEQILDALLQGNWVELASMSDLLAKNELALIKAAAKFAAMHLESRLIAY